MMKHTPWPHYLLAVLLLAGLFAACKKSLFDDAELADHNAQYAFPLFNTTLNIKDLMDQVLNDTLAGDTIQVNADGSMTLFYTGDVAKKPASDIFVFFQTGLVPVVDTVALAPLEAPDSVTIRQANLKSGRFNLVILNSTQDTITGVFQIPQMTLNGVVFSYPFVLPPNPGPLPWISPEIPLAGYILKSDNNTLAFRYEAYDESGTRIKIPDPSPGVPGVAILFNELEFSYLEGYWGYTEYPLVRDTIDIDINQTNLDGNVHIVNPKVTMTVFNSWGFPTRGVVKYLSFIGQNGQELALESTLFNNDSVDFNYPMWINGEVGQTKLTSFTLDNTNSNIEQIFDSQPTQLIYDVAGISNATKDPTIVGFMTDSSVIGLRMRVELVLEGSAKNFGAEQTVDLDFGDNSEIDTANIESVQFRLATENGTPITNRVQLYFQDSTGVAIDSLFDQGPVEVMQAAPVDANGVVIDVNRTVNYVDMDAIRFERIRHAKTAFLKLSFSTFTAPDGSQQPVKLLANMNVTFKMGLIVRTKY